MKSKYVWHNGAWLNVTGYRPAPRKTPYIIRDGMAAAVHPATGQVLDSKSQFREITRAHGLVEVGNDIPTIPTKPVMSRAERKRDIATAIDMLEGGYSPPPSGDVPELSGVQTRVFE
jgi:hypothetical protein